MAYSIDMYDMSGKVVWKESLSESVFNDDFVNEGLIHEYYLLQRSNARNPIACTKWRWEIKWSGKKLYKQKGTGNARVWDKKSPIRRGGWVAFWPRWVQNFTKNMSKKMRRLALNGLLTIKAKDDELCAVKDLSFASPKTKDAIALIKNMDLWAKKMLFVLDKKDDNVTKSLRNIPKVKYLLVDYLNPYDLMHHDKVIFLESALNKINK